MEKTPVPDFVQSKDFREAEDGANGCVGWRIYADGAAVFGDLARKREDGAISDGEDMAQGWRFWSKMVTWYLKVIWPYALIYVVGVVVGRHFLG